MSKLLTERWNKLAFGTNKLTEASYEGTERSPEANDKLMEFLNSLPIPEQDAAGDAIEPGGTQRGYIWENQLQQGIERARETYMGSSGGIGALSAKTQNDKGQTRSTSNFDISLDNTNGNGLHVNDGSGNTRFATVECKLIPSQFGQFKKGQVKTLEFDGTGLVWTHHQTTPLATQSEVDIVLNKASIDVGPWFTQFLQHLNDTMRSAHTLIPEFESRGLQQLQGNLGSINLKTSFYNQLGDAYSFSSNQGSISGQTVGKATALFIIKGGDIKQKSLPNLPDGLGTKSEVNAVDWVKYMSKTKDYLIMGSTSSPKDPAPGCIGSVFAMGSKGVNMGFPQFAFYGSVVLDCRFTADTGGFRMEAKGTLDGVPENGLRFENEIELYDILLKMNPEFLSDFDVADDAVSQVSGAYEPTYSDGGIRGEKGKEISSGGLQTRLARMGKQNYDAFGLEKKIYDNRERKYSLSARLLK